MKRPGRPMFRVVLLLLAWATAGAIVNVAVAWGCARIGPYHGSWDSPFATKFGAMTDSVDEPMVGRAICAGWPLFSVRGLMGWDSASRTGWTIGIVQILSPNPIPYLPIWPGFAVNTVFYAAMLWLLFTAPFALRKRRRIKRGLCPKCAYDLRGSAYASACPECGTAVK